MWYVYPKHRQVHLVHLQPQHLGQMLLVKITDLNGCRFHNCAGTALAVISKLHKLTILNTVIEVSLCNDTVHEITETVYANLMKLDGT